MACRKDCCRILAGAEERAKQFLRSSAFNLSSSRHQFQKGNRSLFSSFIWWKLACTCFGMAFYSLDTLNLFQHFCHLQLPEKHLTMLQDWPNKSKVKSEICSTDEQSILILIFSGLALLNSLIRSQYESDLLRYSCPLNTFFFLLKCSNTIWSWSNQRNV